MEDGSMSFIPNAVPRSRGFLALAFSIFLAAALLHPGPTAAQEVKQIKLTDKHIQGFVGAAKDMARIRTNRIPRSRRRPRLLPRRTALPASTNTTTRR